jgi:hypothetical protein
VSEEEYLESIKHPIPKPDLSTLREDYEIGTDDKSRFYVIYHCHCKICGFDYSFRHEEQLKIERLDASKEA